MTSTFEDADLGRLSIGWFGAPWPSGICYDEIGAVRDDMRIPTPVGERCIHCIEIIQKGDQGKALPPIGKYPHITYTHRECLLREALGPLKHVTRECACKDRSCRDDTGMTHRQEAIAVWNWAHQHGLPRG